MNLIICENYEEMSKAAADLVAQQLEDKPNSVLGLATGSTPVRMYEILGEMNKDGKVDFKDASSFNLDEYYPIGADNDQSYHYFMEKNLFSKINIPKERTHILDGMCDDTKEECQNFEKMIKASGGIDLQILGIGQNGHIGFNEPNQNLKSMTHLTDLTQNTIVANSRFFDDISDVPTQALTMGIGTILKAKKIVLLANGANKHKAVRSLLTPDISTEIPASMLKVHPDVTLICDRAAYSNDCIGVDIGGTEIKFGVLNSDNELVYKDQIPTDVSSEEKLISDIAEKCHEIMDKFCITGIGVGTPGIIENGLVSAANLPFDKTPLAKKLKAAIGRSVKVANDANCAALGESICGAGQDTKNLVMVSLGTGIGGGLIMDSKIYQGSGAAGEIGHICIEVGGKDCPCGEKGCWEQYASAKALVNSATDAAEKNKESILYKKYQEKGKMSGRVFFDAISEGCELSKEVLDGYLTYLAEGIRSIIFVFAPDMIVLAGGISNAGDMLLKPLGDKLNSDVPIVISKLKSDAGTIGAALLVEK